MVTNFKKNNKYSRFEVYKLVTKSDDKPTFHIAQTGYGKIGDELLIFMNIGIPGRAGIDYKNHYDGKTETISWCAKKDTHSGQPLMKQIINGELHLHFFARWKRDENEWTYLGQGEVTDYKDGVPVADSDGKDALCMEYQLTCKNLSNSLKPEEIKAGALKLSNKKPKKRVKRESKRKFKGRKSPNYVLKAKKDKYIGNLGEELVMRWEQDKLRDYGIKDYMKKVEHTSKVEGDGTGYDIKSLDENGNTIYIEVKSTEGGIDTEFFISPNEVEFSKIHKNNFYIYRVFDLNIKKLSGELYITQGYVLDEFDYEVTEFKLSHK